MGEKGTQFAFLGEWLRLLVAFGWLSLFPRCVMIILLGEKQFSAADVTSGFPRWGCEKGECEVSEPRDSLAVYQGTLGFL